MRELPYTYTEGDAGKSRRLVLLLFPKPLVNRRMQ
jgi:hypothetical protein